MGLVRLGPCTPLTSCLLVASHGKCVIGGNERHPYMSASGHALCVWCVPCVLVFECPAADQPPTQPPPPYRGILSLLFAPHGIG